MRYSITQLLLTDESYGFQITIINLLARKKEIEELKVQNVHFDNMKHKRETVPTMKRPQNCHEDYSSHHTLYFRTTSPRRLNTMRSTLWLIIFVIYTSSLIGGIYTEKFGLRRWVLNLLIKFNDFLRKLHFSLF